MICSIIVRYKLPQEHERFTEWKDAMDRQSGQANGFLDKTELPFIPNEPYHWVILRFNSKANAEDWLYSSERKTLLQGAEAMVEERLEMLHESSAFLLGVPVAKNTKKWKQVLVSFVAVYPLTQAIPIFVQILFKKLGFVSDLFAGIVVGVIISLCMVYFAVPFVLKLFRKWLKFPNLKSHTGF